MHPVVLKDLRRMIDGTKKAAAITSPSEIKLDMWSAPLCVRFLTPLRQCDGCPVMQKTGYRLCKGTPRVKIDAALTKWEDALARGTYVAVNEASYRKAVAAQVALLEGLAATASPVYVETLK